MSLGLGRALLMSVVCVLACCTGRAAAQTSPEPPADATPSAATGAAAAATGADTTDTSDTGRTSGGAVSEAPQAQPAAPQVEPSPEPSPEVIERARAAYAAGQESFASGDFSAALKAFEDAYANVANPIVLLSIAESAVKVGAVGRALAAYDAYLKARPDAPDREEVAHKRAALAATLAPAQLTIKSEPAGAEVILDGQLLGKVTPLTVEVRPGTHRISLVLTGYRTARLSAELTAAAHEERSAVLEPAPGLVVAQTAQPAPKQPDVDWETPKDVSEPPRAAIITTGSLGAAGIVAGTVLGIFALKERSDFNNNPTEAGADRGERLALFSDVGFGIGAMSLITTAVLLFTHDEPTADKLDRADDESQGARLEVVPSFTARSASASAKVRF